MKPLACLVTIAVAVPAGWHPLDADIQADGPKLRPPQQSLRIDDAIVELQLDRGVLPTGGTLSAILVATSDRPHAVTVDLTTFQDEGFGGERVENPPLTIDHRKIVLQAQPGGGPPIVASVKLGNRREAKGRVEWFYMVATKPGKAAADEAARVGVAAWPGNTLAMSIEPQATIPAEGPFTVAVRVKNTTRQPLGYFDISLGGRIAGWDSLDRMLELDDDDYDVASTEVADYGRDTLEVGAERVEIFKVTPKRPGIRHFTLVANVRVGFDGALETAVFDRPAVEPATKPAIATK